MDGRLVADPETVKERMHRRIFQAGFPGEVHMDIPEIKLTRRSSSVLFRKP
jgi:hypothetical protein